MIFGERENERPPPGLRAVAAHVDIENFALVNFAVPPDRIGPLVPDRFELDTVADERGREIAFVTASCFCNREFRPALSRRPSHSFSQNTFRTYVTHRGRRGSYFVGTYVDTPLSFAGQWSVAVKTELARMTVDTGGGGGGGYDRYACQSVTDRETLSFVIEATDRPHRVDPFGSGDDLVAFITHRLHGYAKSPLGVHAAGRVWHRLMTPWFGRLLEGRFDFWTARGVLTEEEAMHPHSVLVEPSVRFTIAPPWPLFAV